MVRKLQKFLVAPYETGLQRDKSAWLIGNDAFTELRNAYIFRGRIRKRFGGRYPNEDDIGNPEFGSRLRVQVGTTDSTTGNVNGTVPDLSSADFVVGQQFSIGEDTFTVTTAGTPATLLRSDGLTDTAEFNTNTGAFTINNADPDTPVFFYTGLPVMGLRLFEEPPFNDEATIAFDTRFAYSFSGGSGWTRISSGAIDATWSGTDSDFFWTVNYRGNDAYTTRLFITNNVPADGIRVYDGSTLTKEQPIYAVNSGDDLLVETARIILPFKDRLLLFNTVEQVLSGGSPVSQRFVNRIRFSANGGPFIPNAWRQDIPGNGDFIEAPTKEAIVSAAYSYDRLIVYFERSTYELAYTQSQVYPFIFRKINSELGAESTFSITSVNESAYAVGNVGIHASDGSTVQRLDQKIPDEVFRIRNNNAGVERVYGIRDFEIEHIYWAYPFTEEQVYPSNVFVYNYNTGSWGINDDTITCFGYFFNTDNRTWESDETWQDSDGTWVSGGNLDRFMNVIAGNQQGYTFIADPNSESNTASLSITNIQSLTPGLEFTVINHNLAEGDYVQIVNAQMEDPDNGNQDANINDTIFIVDDVVDENTFRHTTTSLDLDNTYTGSGLLRRVSRVDIQTKEYGFFLDKGTASFVPKVEIYASRTTSGQLTVDYFTDSSNLNLRGEAMSTGAHFGTNKVDLFPYTTYEGTQTRLWHPLYMQAEGETIQLRFFYSDDEMTDPERAFSDMTMHAMLFYVSPAVRTID